jgi:hypothetical protein
VSNLLDVLRGTAGEIFPASEAQISRELAAQYRRWLSVAPAGRAPFGKTSISLITGKKARIVSPRFFRFN